MIGTPDRFCCICGTDSTVEGLFTDYIGRLRYVCRNHLHLSVGERNRILLTSSTTELRRE